MWTVRDAEHIVILISIAGGLFCARVWSVVAVTAIAALLFPTLLTLFVSPDWKRLGFERYFEMQAGNFIALIRPGTSSWWRLQRLLLCCFRRWLVMPQHA